MSNDPIVILSVLALLPLIPAILLFKLLPGGNTEVEGPLAGLKIKMGGAFGGYIALTVFLATFYTTSIKRDGTDIEKWTVTGDIVGPQYSDVVAKLTPALSVDPGNGFAWEIPVPKGTDLPSITLDANGYEGETIYLSPKAHVNKKHAVEIKGAEHVIHIAPITLRRKDAPPAQLTAGGL
jgi:hypothetical protein